MGSQRACEVVEEAGEIHCYFVHADHIGSSNIITNETGQRASLFEYKPFGQVAYADEANTYDTDKKFTGKTYDSTTGLYYYGARYYDPELGRFLTPDNIVAYPFDPQCLNRYTYCRNNPIIYTDPSGNFWGIFAAIVAILGIVSKIAAAAAVVSTVAAGISAIAGAHDLAKTFATIGMISGGVALGAGLLSAGGLSIIKANGILIEGAKMAMPGFAGDVVFNLPPIIVTASDAVAEAVAFTGRMAAGSIITSGVGAGSSVLSYMVSSAVTAGATAGKTAIPGYSTTMAGANQFNTSAYGADIYGANLNVVSEGYYSAVEWNTISPYSKGTISIDNVSARAQIGRTGIEAEASASIIEVSSEHKLFTIKDTVFYAHSSGGWGAKAKFALRIDLQKGSGKTGAGIGLGPTSSFELRWKNVNRWK